MGVAATFMAPRGRARQSTIFHPTPRRNELRAYTPLNVTLTEPVYRTHVAVREHPRKPQFFYLLPVSKNITDSGKGGAGGAASCRERGGVPRNFPFLYINPSRYVLNSE